MNDTIDTDSPEMPSTPSSNGGKKSRGRPFKPGNTTGKGRPKGSRNKTSVLVKELLAVHAEEITGRLIHLAKKGHPGALKLAMGILCPTQSEEPVTWAMPPVEDAGDLVPAYSALLEAVTNGELTSRQAQEIKSILDSMLIAFKNKLGPAIKHIIEWKVVEWPPSRPEKPQESATMLDTPEEAA